VGHRCRRADLPQFEADVDSLAASTGTAAQRELVAALRGLLVRWHTEAGLALHCYGD
jgi:hypothetical protein